MIARHFADMERQTRERLVEAADLIAKFTALAASKDLILGPESFEYIQTTGIVAKAPGIARRLLGPIRTERDGLLPFNEIASRLPPSRLLKNDVDSKPPILPLRIADGYSHHARSEAWNSWVFDRFHAFSA